MFYFLIKSYLKVTLLGQFYQSGLPSKFEIKILWTISDLKNIASLKKKIHVWKVCISWSNWLRKVFFCMLETLKSFCSFHFVVVLVLWIVTLRYQHLKSAFVLSFASEQWQFLKGSQSACYGMLKANHFCWCNITLIMNTEKILPFWSQRNFPLASSAVPRNINVLKWKVSGRPV
jgi:hypothetical protein